MKKIILISVLLIFILSTIVVALEKSDVTKIVGKYKNTLGERRAAYKERSQEKVKEIKTAETKKETKLGTRVKNPMAKSENAKIPVKAAQKLEETKKRIEKQKEIKKQKMKNIDKGDSRKTNILGIGHY